MASWLVCLSSDRAVQVQALAGHIVLYSWTRHLINSHSAQVYKWVTATLLLEVALQWTSIPPLRAILMAFVVWMQFLYLIC